MTIARVALSAVATGINGGTTSGTGVDTTGASLIIAAVTSYFSGASVTGDNMGNGAYTPLTQYGATSAFARIWYKFVTTGVGAGHTITVSGASTYDAFCLIAYSGVAALDTSIGAAAASPGSLTPAGNNELLISVASNGGSTSDLTAASGFTVIAHQGFVNSVNATFGVAELIQTTGSAQNPTWSGPNTNGTFGSTQAAFTASGGGGGGKPLFRKSLLNGLGSGGPFFNNPLGRSMLPKLVTT